MPNWTTNVLDVTYRGVKGKVQLEELTDKLKGVKNVASISK